MKKLIYIFFSFTLSAGIFWLLYIESNTEDQTVMDNQKDVQQVNQSVNILEQNDLVNETPANVSDIDNYQTPHQHVLPKKPVLEVLSMKERQQYIEQKNRAENQIKEIIQLFSENLHNKEKRLQLESEIKIHAKEYKQAMLKLGKDVLSEKN